MEESMVCVHCGTGIHRTTEEEINSLENPEMAPPWKHNSGFWWCQYGNCDTKAEPGGAPKEVPEVGNTLSDFADSVKAFKRPMLGSVYGFPLGSEHLQEIMPDGTRYMPRLTREDIKATDWEEVR